MPTSSDDEDDARARRLLFSMLCGLIGGLLMSVVPSAVGFVRALITQSDPNLGNLLTALVTVCGVLAGTAAGLVFGAMDPGSPRVKRTIASALWAQCVAAVLCALLGDRPLGFVYCIATIPTFFIGWRYWPQPWRRVELGIWILLPIALIGLLGSPPFFRRREDVEVYAMLVRAAGVAFAVREERAGVVARSWLARSLAVLGELAVLAIYFVAYADWPKAYPDVVTLVFMLAAMIYLAVPTATRASKPDTATP